MTPKHTTYDPNASAVDVRDAVEDRGGFFSVSLPISSDSVARDQDQFTTDRLRGFAQQINSDRMVPVFLSHGRSELSEERYGALGKVGRVSNADLNTRDGVTLLEADLNIADPDELSESGDTGDIEAALRWVRQQFQLGLGSVSVGWNEDVGGRDVPGDAELLEVSVVGIESDTQAQQSAAEPSQAAVRGFEALPSRDTSPPDDWGFRGYEPAAPTDEERAVEALEALEHVREFHSQDSDTRAYNRRDETPQGLATIDEILRQFGYSSSSTSVEERLEALDGDDRRSTREREDLLARLETVDERTRKLAQPETSRPSVRGQTAVYPFGRTADESHERISDAVETLRDVLTEDEEIAGWGMQAIAEGDR